METIFLTGATGHVGFRVLVLALQAGYSVRAAVRSLTKSEAILDSQPIKALNPGSHLGFVEIPDLAAEGAFDEILEGVTFVVHVAAPITSTVGIGDDLEAHFIEPSVQGTLNLLRSARKHASIRRVVITSSLAAIVDTTNPEEASRTQSRTFRIPRSPYSSSVQAYCAAKALALNAAEEWMKEQQPSSGVTHILPGDIYGPNELVTNPDDMLQMGTNRILLTPVVGGHYDPSASTTIHLDDVANAHIAALRPEMPTNRLYLLHSGGVSGNQVEDLFEIVRRNFPDDVEKALANNGTVSTFRLPVDASESERTLGFQYLGYEKQVTDVVAYYLHHLKRRGAPAAA
ncbi:hypothetical protein TRIATDRAFT_217178 [Trichoderma atroviride IMI 206040]|uniref:NAD-dependent epimerase/dehydratase domain-containing protein n=1 Tax=Hypocrea atroviridis (strain ATCC 20476 / IMI 206040) TaxID=452589 RepID=G9NQN6_HYPAI|nr:uncharacterized protein TRIATDRAFT_217178 [Trichoderma atroviride IMI 206040]EHK46859.1 hypothetical protein TRIATDRAFT_217178 [Trichoderma atroviride IMI 206040]